MSTGTRLRELINNFFIIYIIFYIHYLHPNIVVSVIVLDYYFYGICGLYLDNYLSFTSVLTIGKNLSSLTFVVW